MSTFSFLKEGLRHIKTTGTVFRSGRALCEAAVERIDFDQVRLVVELGAGDGVITRHILEKLHPDAKVLAFELSKDLCDNMRKIDDDRLIVAEASAEELPEWLDKMGTPQADAFVCSLPFAALPAEVGQNIINYAYERLRPGGPYNQVHYSLKRKAWYEATFDQVEKRRVWKNMPPAWVLYCKKS